MPHSDTSGSKPARGSPKIFAACHVLHRLLAPRHPPDALLILNLRTGHRYQPQVRKPASTTMSRSKPRTGPIQQASEPDNGSNQFTYTHTYITSPKRRSPTNFVRDNKDYAQNSPDHRRLTLRSPPAPESSRTPQGTQQNLIHNYQRTN